MSAELPHLLREAAEGFARRTPHAELSAAAGRLSQRYRGEVKDGRMHVTETADAAAYALVRMPATYAAVRTAMASVAESLPGFAPLQLLDIGSGPGTAAWAASDAWGSLESILAVEGSPAMAEMGRRFWATRARGPALSWSGGGIEEFLGRNTARHDLVTLAYVLNELEAEPAAVASRAWAATQDVLLIVEPGTPAGWKRILKARSALIEKGAHVIAPCPHAATCPLREPDWCHFSQRVPRSREHRLAKEAELGWEDEKYIYIAASRAAVPSPQARVLMPPRHASGRVWLKLCQPDGSSAERLVTKREGEAFRRARRLDWGDRAELG